MKMAKASERDIDAAGDLMALLNTIDDGYYPADKDDENAPLHFDEDDQDHLRMFYDKVKALLDRAPGFPGRVIGGMCYVILYDKNEIVDPDADVIELHPKLINALTDSGRLDWLLPNLHPADFGLEFNGGYEWGSDAEFLAKWRKAIDAAMQAQRNQQNTGSN